MGMGWDASSSCQAAYEETGATEQTENSPHKSNISSLQLETTEIDFLKNVLMGLTSGISERN